MTDPFFVNDDCSHGDTSSVYTETELGDGRDVICTVSTRDL